jgi:hypothetical protein
MKAYGDMEKIAAAKPDDIAAKSGITLISAKAVRAAARLALEDREEMRKNLAAQGGFAKTGTSKTAAALAEEAALPDEAFAAEAPPEYE